MHKASLTIASLYQGGLGLPDRDYYFRKDDKSVETRRKYVEHVTRMFELLGDSPQAAAAEAKTVMEIGSPGPPRPRSTGSSCASRKTATTP